MPCTFVTRTGLRSAEMPPGIQAPGFNFTAYVKSAYLRELDEQNALVLEELNRDLKAILDATKDKLREYFRQRTAEGAADVVEEWKRAKLYPFEGEAKNILEVTERQIFDVVASEPAQLSARLRAQTPEVNGFRCVF